MTQKKSAAVVVLPLLSNAAAFHTLLVLFAFRKHPIADHVGMLIWWVSLLVCYCVLSLFLRQPREMRSVIILGAAVFAVQLTVTVLVNPIYGSFTNWFACLCMWIYGYYQCVFGLLQGVKPETLTVNFETTSAMLLLTAALSSAGAMPMGTVVHLAFAQLCILIALMRLRTLHTRMDDCEKRPAVEFIVPLIILVAAACAVLFCVAVSGHAAQILSQFTAWLGKLLKMIADGIGAFFLWLFSLFPQVQDPTGGEAFAPDALPGGMPEMAYESNGALLYILIGAVIAALLVLVFKIWRTVQLQSPKTRRKVVSAVTVKKSGLWDVLQRLLLRVLRRVWFELHYWQNRNSLGGLLVWLERQMARKGIKRAAGETTRVYLLRVGERYPEGENTLRGLSVALDRHYFGGGTAMTKDEIQEMRKALKAMQKE